MITNQSQTQDEAQANHDETLNSFDLETTASQNEYKSDEEIERTPSAVSPREYPIYPLYPTNNDENPHHNENINDDLLVLMDWDDTLFPTTVIVEILKNRDRNGFALVCDDHIRLLDQLGNSTLKLLTQLINKYGSDNIYIVTNSLEGWVADSLCFAACISAVYNDIKTLLQKNNITMQSAQTMYANNTHLHLEASTPTLWKQFCFSWILNGDKTKSSYKHIISIGDQWTDHHAVKQSINLLTGYSPIHHMIKLKMAPNLADMINEILYVETCFSQIFDIISCANCECMQAVIIDYHREEVKHYQDHISNTNDLNVNVISK